MQTKEAQWRDKIKALLDKKGWDMKDWHRAISVSQWVLEEVMNDEVKGIADEVFEKLYLDTKKAKRNSTLMRFEAPRIIAVWTHKGGTGKSTTSTNLAYELALRGYNVLPIDTDSQSDMTSVLHPSYLDNPDVSFYQAFVMHDDFKEEGYIIHTNYPNLDIIPGSAKCESLESYLSSVEESIRNKYWSKCLKRIRQDNYYDFILIDMDKTAGLMNKTILNEADYVLSPIECGIFAVKSVPPILAQIEEVKRSNSKLELLGLLFNKVDMRKKKTVPESMELVEQMVPGAALKEYIKNDANIDNSQREHMPLGEYNKSCIANKQMIALTNEILERIKKNEN